MPTTTSLLDRALALLPPDEPGRVELLADLAEGRMQAGDFQGTDALYAEMLEIARASGDRGLEVHAGLRRAVARFLVEPRDTPVPDLRAVASDAVETLEELGDTRPLADALGGLAMTSWLIGDARGMLELSERSMHLARSSESWRALPQSVYYIGRALVLGPTPCSEGAERLQALVAEFADRPMVQASARLDLALLHAMLGHREEAAADASAAREVFRELGQRRWLAAAGITSGIVTWLHGDPLEAEREVRGAYELFRERGEREEAALTAQELAKIVFDLGRLDEADALIDEVLGVMAPDDVEPQIESRTLRARILAARGSFADAERLSAEAEELVRATDFRTLHGSVLLGQAHVLDLAGGREDAIAAAEGALERFERKENLAWADRTRAFLGQLTV
jgi:tetratricopeptide (TPR) repeat protein